MKEYLRQSSKKSKSSHFMWNGRINVYNSKDLPEEIDIEEVLSGVSERMPSFFLSNIESIYIGDIAALERRDMDAIYENGTIYISSTRAASEEDLVDDIIHEISHSLEESNSLDIYGDGQIEREFIAKRMKLYNLLRREDVVLCPRDFFLNTEYSKEFDEFLYKIVGYPLLTSVSMNLFVSPYGATSLREYFANSFEKYFMGEYEAVKNISPQVYKKIIEMINNKEENAYGDF